MRHAPEPEGSLTELEGLSNFHLRRLSQKHSRAYEERAREPGSSVGETQDDGLRPGGAGGYQPDSNRDRSGTHLQRHGPPPILVAAIGDGDGDRNLVRALCRYREIGVESPAQIFFTRHYDCGPRQDRVVVLTELHVEGSGHLLRAAHNMRQATQRGEADRNQEDSKEDHQGNTGSEQGRKDH